MESCTDISYYTQLFIVGSCIDCIIFISDLILYLFLYFAFQAKFLLVRHVIYHNITFPVLNIYYVLFYLIFVEYKYIFHIICLTYNYIAVYHYVTMRRYVPVDIP